MSTPPPENPPVILETSPLPHHFSSPSIPHYLFFSKNRLSPPSKHSWDSPGRLMLLLFLPPSQKPRYPTPVFFPQGQDFKPRESFTPLRFFSLLFRSKNSVDNKIQPSCSRCLTKRRISSSLLIPTLREREKKTHLAIMVYEPGRNVPVDKPNFLYLLSQQIQPLTPLNRGSQCFDFP